MKRVLFAAAILVSCFHQFACAQDKLAVLSLKGSGVEASTLETVYMLLVSDIRDLMTYEVIPENEILPLLGDRGCSEPACAIDIGRQSMASKVVIGSLNKLGEKVIFKYHLIDVATGATLLTDDLSALRVEDLDQVTKRIAASIVQQVPAERTLEVGLVTEQEALEVNSRKASSSWGIAFGYLYPQDGYDDKESIFVWDFRSLYETRRITVDAVLGFRQGFALNIGFLYLFGRQDISPFVGAGIGFHSVSHERFYEDYYPGDYYYNDYHEEELNDGVEFLIKAGFLAFRTYDFRVVANVEYGVTLNDYDDQAIVLTIGVLRSGKRVFGIF